MLPGRARGSICLLGQSLTGDCHVLFRTLLQQLQKLQTLVANKISRPYKMAATQTGTCLMVGAASSLQGHRGTDLPHTGFQVGGQSSEGLATLWATPLGYTFLVPGGWLQQSPVSFTKSMEPSRT